MHSKKMYFISLFIAQLFENSHFIISSFYLIYIQVLLLIFKRFTREISFSIYFIYFFLQLHDILLYNILLNNILYNVNGINGLAIYYFLLNVCVWIIWFNVFYGQFILPECSICLFNYKLYNTEQCILLAL